MHIITSVYDDNDVLQNVYDEYYCNKCEMRVNSNYDLEHYIRYVLVINPDKFSTLDNNVKVVTVKGVCCKNCISKMKNENKN